MELFKHFLTLLALPFVLGFWCSLVTIVLYAIQTVVSWI